MTKAGEGSGYNHQNVERHKRDLKHTLSKFTKEVESYYDATEGERMRLRSNMNEEWQKVRALVTEMPRSGTRKEASIAENSYAAYITDPTPDTFAALKHDIVTLRIYVEE